MSEGFNSKVPVPAGKPSIGRNPGNDSGSAMPGSKGQGPAVSTVKSQPITGKNGNGTEAMPKGIISGKV